MRPRDVFTGTLAAGLAAAATVAGPPPSLDRRGEDLARVRLVADAASVTPGGTFHLAIVFDVEPQWHIYWKNPGSGAMAPQIEIDAPDGFAVGPVQWPRPIAIETPIGVDYCYLDQAVLFVPVTAPATEGHATMSVRLTWAVCQEVCKIGRAELHADVEVTTSPRERADDPVVTRHRRRLPRPLTDQEGAAISFADGVLTLVGPAGGQRRVGFYPDASPGVVYGEATAAVDGDRFRITVPVVLEPGNALGEPMRLGGLVVTGRRPDDPCYDFERALDPDPPPGRP